MRLTDEPGFWNEYAPPQSHVAELVQRPLAYIDGDALCVAYMRDWREAKARRALEDGGTT